MGRVWSSTHETCLRFCLHSPHPNPLFLIHFPFLCSPSLPLAFYLLLCPSELLIVLFAPFPCSSFLNLPFHSASFTSLPGLCFFNITSSSLLHPFYSFFFPPRTSVLPTPLKAAKNSPVLFPLVLLKEVLWDGINQHQV